MTDPLHDLLAAFADDVPSLDDEAAADRILERLTAAPATPPKRAPRDRSSLPRWVLPAAALALAFVAGRGFAPPPPAVQVIVPPADAPTDPLRMEAPERTAAAPSTPAPLPPSRDLAPAPPPRAPRSTAPFGEGLQMLANADAHRRGDAAVLTRGMLRFVRDDATDPGVERVVLGRGGPVAVPIGTVFVATVAPEARGIAVREGRVILQAPDGTPLGEVRAGEAAFVEPDGGWRLDRLDGRTPHAIADGRAGVADLVVDLRLAALPSVQRSQLAPRSTP